MKLKILVLTLGLGGSLLLSSAAFAQNSDRTVDSLQTELANEKDKTREVRAEDNSSDLKDMKRASKAAKRKAKDASRIERDAKNAAKESKRAYKAEKSAQKARDNAEKQAKRAAKAQKRANDH